MRRKFSSRSAAFVEVDDLFCLDSHHSDRTMSTSYIEADPWQRVSEEEVITAAAQVEEDRSSDLLSDSRRSLDPDHDLTNLNWLLGFSASGPHTEAPRSSSPEEPAFTDVPQIPSKAVAYRRTWPDHQCPDEVDYKTNPTVKPPYTYASMIYMAMQASDKPKITLADINKWIMDNFSYYRYAEPTWQNCIRHNLSLKKCFVKVPRKKNEPGKGGFWTIDPRHTVRLVIGAYKNPHMINPVLSNNPNITVQPESTFVSTRDDTQVNHESNQLLNNNLMETDQDSCSAEDTWISEESEHLFGHSNDCSPPPFVLDQKEGHSSSTGLSELDPLLTSAWNEDLIVNYGRPLSPVPVDEDLINYGNHISVQELLSDSSDHQEMLERHCSGEEADDPLLKSVLQNCLDLLASSAENMEPLYDFETTVQVQTQTLSQDHKAHLRPI